jgi:hypothetical protein
LEEAKHLAAEFGDLGGGALTMALAQEAESGDSLRECWLAHERLHVSEARSINRAEILTARTDAAAEVAGAAAAEAAAAEASAAVEAVATAEAAAAVEAAAAAGAAAKAATDAPGAEAALAPELDLVEMLGHKGESYSQAIVELGFQLMAMRLTAEKAVNVTRALMQLQHPDKVEGNDYRIPLSARFREWRRFLGPICHYLSLSVIKLATKIHALHDATTKPNSNFEMKLHLKVFQQVLFI